MPKVHTFKNGIEIIQEDNETLYEALYNYFCKDCIRAHHCHNACCEFDGDCYAIDELEEIAQELGYEDEAELIWSIR